MRGFEAYHIHSHLTNMIVPDSIVSKKDFAERFVEIGNMHMLSTCEHGFQGDIYFANDVCEKIRKTGYDLRPVQVSEAYFVPNRLEKDNTNAHLIVAAINEAGRREMNLALSEANLSGFYYRPRLDFELLESMNPENFIVTTACIAGIWKYDEGKEYSWILHNLKKHFGDNFYLEIQAHNTEKQKEVNSLIRQLYLKGHKIIAGTDSHHIYREQDADRDYYLKSRKIEYAEEEGWDLDLPTVDELFERFRAQGVFSEPQIEEAIKNTLIFRKCNNPEYGTEYDLNRNKKIPNPYKDKPPEERIAICKRKMFDAYQQLYPNATPEERERDFAELRHEVQSIEVMIGENMPMADYFLIVSRILKKGIEKGGVLTRSGRGSGVSFFTNHLLGFTSVNRITAPVKMYADRFISKERIEGGTLPDFDANLGDPTPFVQGAQEVLGEWGVAPMIAYGKMRAASAWKMYARAHDVPAKTANDVSDMLKKYERDVKYAKEDLSDVDDLDEDVGIDVAKYVPAEYLDMVLESQRFLGIIDSFSPHPCAHIMLDGDVREEIGLVRLKNTGGVGTYGVLIDGDSAERYGYLKLDLLRVDVVKVIQNAFDAAGIPVPSEKELLEITEGDEDVWGLYAKGHTMGLNQVERSRTRGRVQEYRPRNIEELTAFIAAIRPGFKTMLGTFIDRGFFQYGVEALDKLLGTPKMPSSFILYQEQIMLVLQEAGISASESYDCIKAISKKNFQTIHHFKERFMEGFYEKIKQEDLEEDVEALDATEKVWDIIEDNASYGFNSAHAYCVALDSLYGAQLKARYPYEFYAALMDNYLEKKDKKRISLLKNEMREAHGIEVVRPAFGENNVSFLFNREDKTITDSLVSVKGIGEEAASALYAISEEPVEFFVDVLARCVETPRINKGAVHSLIMLGYFKRFGSIGELLAIYEEFYDGEYKYRKTYVENTKARRLEVLRGMEFCVNPVEVTPADIIAAEVEHLCIPSSTWNHSRFHYVVIEVNEEYTPTVYLYNLSNGNFGSVKIRKRDYFNNKMKVGDIIKIEEWRKSNSFVTKSGYSMPAITWLDKYRVYDSSNPRDVADITRALEPEV